MLKKSIGLWLVVGLIFTIGCAQTTETTTTTTTTIPTPPPPTGLRVDSSVGNTIDLIWQPTSESGMAGYNVYRSTTSSSGYTKISTIKVGTVFWDTGTMITTSDPSARLPLAAGGAVLYYPTPHNLNTVTNGTIQYALPNNADTELIIYDVLGNIIWNNSYSAGANGGRAGINKIVWEGKNNNSQLVSNGIYPLKLAYDSTVKGGFILIWDGNSNLTTGTRYYYVVTAFNALGGESTYSEEISAEAISNGITHWPITIEAGTDPADPIYKIDITYPSYWGYVTE